MCDAICLGMLDLSIIVPVYNVEKYLPRCVDTLLEQDMSADRYEVVLVDDGSTDNSGVICERYAAQHQNIRVIHQKNQGLSEARNTGIDNSSGRYVMFVDSDDYLQPRVLRAIVEKMDHDKLDVLRFNYQDVDENGQVLQLNKISKPYVDYSDSVCDGVTFLSTRLGGACYAWQFALTRELTRIRFTRGRYFEDMLWTPFMLLEAKRVTSVDMMVYNYLYRSGSISRTNNISKKRKTIEDKLFIIRQYIDAQQTIADKRWFAGQVASMVVGVLTMVAADFYSERDSYLRQIEAFKAFPLSDYHATKYFRRKLRLANLLGPRLFCRLMHFKAMR